MDWEVGQRILRKSNGREGYIHSIVRKRLIEVRWTDTAVCEVLPIEEFRLPDRTEPPTAESRTSWGNTTPRYLVDLRKKLRSEPKPPNPFEVRASQERLANQLVGLSGKKKNRSRMKAQKIVAQFEARNRTAKEWENILPVTRHLWTAKERNRLNERIARDDRHDGDPA